MLHATKTFTPGLEFKNKRYSCAEEKFEAEAARALDIIKGKLNVSPLREFSWA